jgi:hypothetical protein
MTPAPEHVGPGQRERAPRDLAVETYVRRAQLALMHAACFVVAAPAYAVLRLSLEVAHPRAVAAAYLLPALVALALKLSAPGDGRGRVLLLATSAATLGIIEAALVLMVYGGQGTLVAGTSALLVGLVVLTFADRRILTPGR